MRRWTSILALPLGLATAAGGCGVPLTEQGVALSNHCDDDSDCGSNGTCQDNICVSTEADLGNVVIQFDVPAGAPFAVGTSQLVTPNDTVDLTGSAQSYNSFYDLVTAEQAQVVVSFVVNQLPEPCSGLAAADNTIPIAIELHPTPSPFPGATGPAGIPLPPYTASSVEEDSSHAASITVPRGFYDIYVIPQIPEPKASAEPPCKLPPALLQTQELTAKKVAVNLTVEAATELIGVINDFNVQDWTIDLLENKKGRGISTTALLPLSGVDVGASFTLLYWKSLKPEDVAAPVLRLTPPAALHESSGMPNLYWSLDGQPVTQQGQQEIIADLTLGALEGVEHIEVSGTVVNDGAGYEPVPATLAIQSEELVNGSFGQNVSFKTTIESDSDGNYSVNLLPGTYRVVAVPNDDHNLAVTESTLSLSKGDQGGGKSIVVHRKRKLHGSARTAWSAPANQVSTLLQPTSAPVTSYLRSVLEISDIQPAGATSLTNDQGDFSLNVDPGEYNLSLRPEPSSGLPWAVLSRYTIADTNAPLADVAIVLTNPVVLWGRVTSPFGHPIADARIRAWVLPPVANDGTSELQPSAIQIAETTSDSQGLYRLLLPASISASLSQ